METEPGAAAKTCAGGGAGPVQGACAKPTPRRHFVWAAAAAGLSHFMFLARGQRSLSTVDSFQCGTRPRFSPGQHLVKVGGVRESA